MKNKKVDLKIALLSNFTIKGLSDSLKEKCKNHSISASIYQSDYNQINQEIIDKDSKLNSFSPDITFLIVNNNFIFNESETKVVRDKNERINIFQENFNNFVDLINTFTSNISGILVVSSLKQTTYSPLGINEDKVEYSIKDWPVLFNNSIKSSFITNDRLRIYDFNSFFIKYGEKNIINNKLNLIGDIYISPDYMGSLAEELMGYVKPFASRNRKCIVLDLDNTLWGGIIGEDGINNIKLDDKPPGNSFLEFQKYLLALNERGIILAVNSKNNYEDAIQVIREHPYMLLREENFACIKINWQNKVQNMVDIANEINIGLDSLVFFDDDHLNRELVRQSLPEVLVVDIPQDHSKYVEVLKDLNDFNTLQITDEDFQKGEMYYQQMKRNELKAENLDLGKFLDSLKMNVKISCVNDFTLPRISQLTKKTNQFNLTTRRYSEDDIKKTHNRKGSSVFSLEVKDKFGDNGLTGVIILQKSDKRLIIDTFLLSCRVIGRDLEKVMLYFIQEYAKLHNCNEVLGEYIATQKNPQVSNLYINNGFKNLDHKNKNRYILKDLNKIEKIDYINFKFDYGEV